MKQKETEAVTLHCCEQRELAVDITMRNGKPNGGKSIETLENIRVKFVIFFCGVNTKLNGLKVIKQY